MGRGLIVAFAAALLFATPAQAFDPAYEAANYQKINERAESDYTPEFNALLFQQGLENQAAAAAIVASDGPGREYGRDFSGNLCANAQNGCAGDVRLYDWGEQGYGLVQPVLFTARNGSTLSGHVWSTVRGPAKRPGVVITNGSVQAPETLYWYAAQTLAQAGYVVMTWDPQGQGYSDTYGEGVDRDDGVPSQEGRPFYDGTEDALDFFFSTPAAPYVPRPSCTSGTSHADKQAARVADGRSSAFNPFHGGVDYDRVGIAGHSLGAAAVSYVGQLDPRVKAIVAWDNLRDVSEPGSARECTSGSSPRPEELPLTKPALGMAADYGLTPQPYTGDPDPNVKVAASDKLSDAEVDNGQLNLRGGTHYEFSYIPNPAFGATRRGIDLTAWYTLAWMDKHLKADPTADARLLTNRWHDDRLTKEVDSQTPPDGNLFSTYHPSRFDFARADGTRFTCEDVRTGCGGALAADGLPPDYSFLAAAQVKDATPPPGTPPSTTAPGGSPNAPPGASGPGAVTQVDQAGGCTPRSRITRIRKRKRVLRIRGKATPATSCQAAVTRVTLVIRRGGKVRRVAARGTTRFRARIRVKPGRYRIAAQARTASSIEGAKRGKRVRVRR